MSTKGTNGREGKRMTAIILCLLAFLFWGAAAARCDVTPDEYEDDDSSQRARVIFVNLADQHHDFHDEADEDWVQFSGLAGETYQIESANVGALADSSIELYDTDGQTLLTYADRPHDNGVVDLSWRFLKAGTYYVRVRQNDPLVFGEETAYDLCVWIPVGPPGSGMLTGLVRDSISKRPVEGAKFRTDGNAAATPSGPRGEYLLGDTAGSYTLWASASGYKTLKSRITIVDSKTLLKNFVLTPLDAPDLAIRKVAGPPRAMAGRRISVECTVANQGTQPSGPFVVGIYLSQDEVIGSRGDSLLKRVSVDGLPAQGVLSSSIFVRIPPDQPPGRYHLGAVADLRKSVAESREDNNAGVSEDIFQVR